MDRRANTARSVNPRLRQISEYSWRLLILVGAGYIIFLILLRFELIFIALFIALILASLLRPPINVLARVMPRSLALMLTAMLGLGLLAVLFWQVGNSVAGESSSLGIEFHGGVVRIENWLEGKPFHVDPKTLTNLQGKLTSYVEGHRATLLNQALNGAGRIVDVLTVLALAVFCSIFLANSGDRMWHWFQDQLPESARPAWRRCGITAWRTFAGYTRGIILIAAANAIMVGVALEVLRVPLVLPLTIFEFVASFIPLIGSPIALAVATVVALAGRGMTTAIIVLILIVVLGQIEGHVLQPFVMGWSVRLHPVVVAVSVIAGTLSAGLLGAVVAVPLISIGWAVWREMRSVQPEAGEHMPDDGPQAEPASPPPTSVLPVQSASPAVSAATNEGTTAQGEGQAG